MPSKCFAVILCPLPEEYAVIQKFLKQSRVLQDPDHQLTYATGYFTSGSSSVPVAICECRRGQLAVATAAKAVVRYFTPSYIFLVGTAGSLRKLKVGDVIVGTSGYGFDSGRVREDGFKYAPQVAHSNGALLAKAKQVARKLANHYFEVFFRPIVSSDKVIESRASPEFQRIDQNLNDALAIDMEAYSFLHALESLRAAPPALNIRGISDTLEDKTDQNQKGSKQTATQHAAEFTTGLIHYLYQEDPLLNSRRKQKRRLVGAVLLLASLLLISAMGIIPFFSPPEKLLDRQSEFIPEETDSIENKIAQLSLPNEEQSPSSSSPADINVPDPALKKKTESKTLKEQPIDPSKEFALSDSSSISDMDTIAGDAQTNSMPPDLSDRAVELPEEIITKPVIGEVYIGVTQTKEGFEQVGGVKVYHNGAFLGQANQWFQVRLGGQNVFSLQKGGKELLDVIEIKPGEGKRHYYSLEEFE